jgi:hypothetical protein
MVLPKILIWLKDWHLLLSESPSYCLATHSQKVVEVKAATIVWTDLTQTPGFGTERLNSSKRCESSFLHSNNLLTVSGATFREDSERWNLSFLTFDLTLLKLVKDLLAHLITVFFISTHQDSV